VCDIRKRGGEEIYQEEKEKLEYYERLHCGLMRELQGVQHYGTSSFTHVLILTRYFIQINT